MPRWTRYLLFFLLGIGLGAVYLWTQSDGRGSLESGSEWAVEEVDPHPTPSPAPKTIKIVFGGDVMFDRNIRLAAVERALKNYPEASSASDLQEINYDFVFGLKLQELLSAQDLVVVNLEGPITDNPSLSANTEPGSNNNYFFTFDPAVLDVLRKNNMWLVGLGNNHILNFELEGLEATDSYLQEAGIEWFGWVGAVNSYDDWNRVSSIWEKDGFKLGVINYNQFGQQPLETALKEVERLKDQVHWLVVYPHWGLEYENEANTVIQNQAYQFIDAGADTVIGSHPHVVQQAEVYQGKKIFYSLGNFVFDQYFQPEVKQGLLVELSFDLSQLKAESELGKELLGTKENKLSPVFTNYEIRMLESGSTILEETAAPLVQSSESAQPTD